MRPVRTQSAGGTELIEPVEHREYVRATGIRVFVLGLVCSLELGLLLILVVTFSGMYIGVAIYDLISLLFLPARLPSVSMLPLAILWQVAVVLYFPVISSLIARMWRASERDIPDWPETWEIVKSAGSGNRTVSGRRVGLPSRTNRAGISLSDGTALGFTSAPAIMWLVSVPAFFASVLVARWLTNLLP